MQGITHTKPAGAAGSAAHPASCDIQEKLKAPNAIPYRDYLQNS